METTYRASETLRRVTWIARAEMRARISFISFKTEAPGGWASWRGELVCRPAR